MGEKMLPMKIRTESLAFEDTEILLNYLNLDFLFWNTCIV